jgi:hypothetical protein
MDPESFPGILAVVRPGLSVKVSRVLQHNPSHAGFLIKRMENLALGFPNCLDRYLRR